MSVSKKIVAHLGKRQVKFEIVPHKKVYTAHDLAQTVGTKLENVVKTLLVEVEVPKLGKKGKGHYVVMVPASYNIDFTKLKKALGVKKVSIATEQAIKKLKMVPGAVAPFTKSMGQNVGVAMDKALLKAKDALVSAESYTEHLRMKVKDLVALESPVIASFGKSAGLKFQPKAKPKKPRQGKGKKAVMKARKKPAKKPAPKKKPAAKKRRK